MTPHTTNVGRRSANTTPPHRANTTRSEASGPSSAPRSRASSRPTSPTPSDAPRPQQRHVSGSLKDRIAKFSNADAVPLAPTNPYIGGASTQSSYARGGLVGNRLPSLDPKTAALGTSGLAAPGARRVSERRDLIGNRIPSGTNAAAALATPSLPGQVTPTPGSASNTPSPGTSTPVSAGSAQAGLGIGAPPPVERVASPAGSAASSGVSGSVVSGPNTNYESASAGTSRSSSPATSPGTSAPGLPQLLVSTLPGAGHSDRGGAMTPSSTRAEAGEEVSELSLPSTPVAAPNLPPPEYDLVPGNLKLAAASGTAGGSTYAPSISSSLVSQYDPASSTDDAATNLKDVSGVSTPTGTPRQARRELDPEGPEGSAPSSTRDDGSGGEDDVPKLQEKLEGLGLEEATSGETTATDGEETEEATSPVEAKPVDKEDALAKSIKAATDEPLVKPEEEATPTEEKEVEVAQKKGEPTAVDKAAGAAVSVAAVAGLSATAAAFVPSIAKDKKEKAKVEEPKAEPKEAVETQEESTPKEESVSVITEEPKAVAKETAKVEEPAAPVVTKIAEPAGPTEPEATEDLADEKSAPAEVDEDPRRTSVDTISTIIPGADLKLKPESLAASTDVESALATPVPILPATSATSDTPRRFQGEDRDATPQPSVGDHGDEVRDEALAPALDDDSDIVSLGNGGHSRTHSGFSLPPARASSQLEFNYDEYHEKVQQERERVPQTPDKAQLEKVSPSEPEKDSVKDSSTSTNDDEFFRASSQDDKQGKRGDDSVKPQDSDDKVSAAAAPVLAQGGGGQGPASSSASSGQNSSVTKDATVAATVGGAIAVGGALAAAGATAQLDFRGVQEASAKATEVAEDGSGPAGKVGLSRDSSIPDIEAKLKSFPEVPTGGVDGAAHKPLQVHVEPSPFGPVSDAASPPPPAANGPANGPSLKVQAPSTSVSVDGDADEPRTAPSFPDTPHNELPAIDTPADTPARSGTPADPLPVTPHKHFPEVPDEQHPYVGVHVSPHASSQVSGLKSNSPPLSPSVSSGSLSAIEAGRRQRNSFRARSPLLDDEDPGDFEPGEAWAVVTKWESYSPPNLSLQDPSQVSSQVSLVPTIRPPIPPRDSKPSFFKRVVRRASVAAHNSSPLAPPSPQRSRTPSPQPPSRLEPHSPSNTTPRARYSTLPANAAQAPLYPYLYEYESTSSLASLVLPQSSRTSLAQPQSSSASLALPPSFLPDLGLNTNKRAPFSARPVSSRSFQSLPSWSSNRDSFLDITDSNRGRSSTDTA